MTRRFLNSRAIRPQVHAPAGGRSSLDLFGGFAEAEARAAPRPSAPKPAAMPRAEPRAAEPRAVAPKAPVPATAPSTRPVARDMSNRVSANVFATGANQNCGNFLTERPTSRVLSAPGGRSSIVLG